MFTFSLVTAGKREITTVHSVYITYIMRIIPISEYPTILLRLGVGYVGGWVGLVNYYSGRSMAVAYKSYRYASRVRAYYILYILYPNDA